ncbi:hypothetical protein A6S26_15945 [Nostoc sp. ATCC 43529]|nr:hypothetical protein A6S26_15945 [Nostoc sp. ATCC 43529]
MSLLLKATFTLTPHIAHGLAKGIYVLCGSLIRDTATNKILGFLRGTTATPKSSPNNVLNLIVYGANLLTSGANIAVSAKGFSNVNQRLDKGFGNINQQLDNIENQIRGIAKPMQISPELLQITTAASVPLTGRFEKEAYKRLPQVFEVMESMIETNRRFESYQTEVQGISQLGISFHDWLKLTPSTEVKPEGAELMYVIPSEPLDLQPSI